MRNSSLPVPDSPLINTLIDERDRRPMMRKTSLHRRRFADDISRRAGYRDIARLLLLLIVADSAIDQSDPLHQYQKVWADSQRHLADRR